MSSHSNCSATGAVARRATLFVAAGLVTVALGVLVPQTASAQTWDRRAKIRAEVRRISTPQPSAAQPPSGEPNGSGPSNGPGTSSGPALRHETRSGTLSPGSSPSPAVGGAVPCATCASRDDWLVSSRFLPQEPVEGRTASCPLRVYRAGNGATWTLSDAPTLAAAGRADLPLTIVAHGSFVEPANVTLDAYATSKWMRTAAPAHPVQCAYYTWPSEGFRTPLVGIDVALLGRRAEFNGIYLARFVQELPADRTVCLVGHSHGARIVAAALHLLGGGEVQGVRLAERNRGPKRLRAVLAAAAVDHHWLDPCERYGRAATVAERILILRNREDLPMQFYAMRSPFAEEALGVGGLHRSDRVALGAAGERISEVDVTCSVGTGHTWPNYYERPEIARSIASFVRFDPAATGPVPTTPATPTTPRLDPVPEFGPTFAPPDTAGASGSGPSQRPTPGPSVAPQAGKPRPAPAAKSSSPRFTAPMSPAPTAVRSSRPR